MTGPKPAFPEETNHTHVVMLSASLVTMVEVRSQANRWDHSQMEIDLKPLKNCRYSSSQKASRSRKGLCAAVNLPEFPPPQSQKAGGYGRRKQREKKRNRETKETEVTSKH